MSRYKYVTYDGSDQILKEVRYLIKTFVPAEHTFTVLQKIDDLETTIDETLAGRADMVDEQNDEQ